MQHLEVSGAVQPL